MEFGDDIQNHYEKCIEISTNMPGIGLEMFEFLKTKQFCMDVSTDGRVQSISII